MAHKAKRTYPTKRAALRNLLAASRKTGDPLRVIWCAEHKGYHLTSNRRGRSNV